MLSKALVSTSDAIIFDLEDSVAPNSKPQARQDLVKFLSVCRIFKPCQIKTPIPDGSLGPERNVYGSILH
jgi:HpcH/HpaI aldolase/citrate lyase family